MMTVYLLRGVLLLVRVGFDVEWMGLLSVFLRCFLKDPMQLIKYNL